MTLLACFFAFSKLVSIYYSVLSYFRVFVGLNDKVGKKVQFGAIWSNFGLGMDCICMEQGGWMNLKIKRG